MSYRATNWAKTQGLRGSVQAVLYQLADMADGEGKCHPGHNKIAELIGASRHTVLRAMKVLEEEQLVTRIRRNTNAGYRTSDAYLLNLTGLDLSANLELRVEVDLSAKVERRLTAVPPLVEDGLSSKLEPRQADHLSSKLASPMLQIGSGLSSKLEQQKRVSLTTSVNHQGTTSNTQELATVEAITVDDFYAVWPKKKDKPATTRAWAKAIKRATPEQIIAAAVAFRDNPGRPEPKFIKYPASWLNADGWNDELDVVHIQGRTRLTRTEQNLEYVRRAAIAEGDLETMHDPYAPRKAISS